MTSEYKSDLNTAMGSLIISVIFFLVTSALQMTAPRESTPALLMLFGTYAVVSIFAMWRPFRREYRRAA